VQRVHAHPRIGAADPFALRDHVSETDCRGLSARAAGDEEQYED
jgi:hypothetical protein